MSGARKLFLLGLFLVLLAAGGLIAWRSLSTTLRLGAPRDASPELIRTLQLVGREFPALSRWVSVVPRRVESLDGASRALRDREVDLAILRSDQPMPTDTAVLAVLRTEAVFLLVPLGSKITGFADLANTTLGVLPGPAQNTPLADKILGFYGVDPASVRRILLQPADVVAAWQSKRANAVLIIGDAGRGVAADIFAAASRGRKTPPAVIGADDAAALADSVTFLGSETIPKGAFRGVAPEEEITAPSVEYRLVARSDIGKLAAGEMARMLMSAKAHLVNDPGAGEIEAPDTEQTASPIHPGARAYFDDEPPSMTDNFETLFWVGWALTGIVGSLVTWLVGRAQGSSKNHRKDFQRLVMILAAVPSADACRLPTLRADFDEIVARLVRASEGDQLTPGLLANYQFALTHVRDAWISARKSCGDRQRGSGCRMLSSVI